MKVGAFCQAPALPLFVCCQTPAKYLSWETSQWLQAHMAHMKNVASAASNEFKPVWILASDASVAFFGAVSTAPRSSILPMFSQAKVSRAFTWRGYANQQFLWKISEMIPSVSYHIHLVSFMYSSFSSSPPYPALQILQHKPLAALATPINRRTLIAVTIRTTKFSNSHLVHSWWRQGTSHSLLFEFRQIDLASFRALTASAFTGCF